MGVAEDIAQQYPFLSWLANDPHVGPLLRRAVNTQQPYSAERFQAELMTTPWWNETSDKEKEWQVLVHTRPAEADRQRAEYWHTLQNFTGTLGVPFSNDMITYATEMALRQGIAPDSPQMLQALRPFFTGYPTGKWAATASEIKAMAERDWLHDPTGDWVNGNAANVLTGEYGIEQVNEQLKNWAWNAYPLMQQQIEAGMTVNQIIEPQRQILSRELERTDIDILHDPRWQRIAYGIQDSNTGKQRLMTNSEVMTMAREEPEYWRTMGGREMDNSMSNALLNVFGKRKSSGVS